MLEIKVRVYVNTDQDLDPTFGNVLPDDADAYIIFVTPVKEAEYFFVVLLPEGLDSDTAKGIIKSILKQVLKTGERYDVRPLNHTHTDLISSTTPMIGYNPLKLDADAETWDFFWLIPPKSHMH